MSLGNRDHPFEAVGINPVVPKYHFAVSAVGGNLTQSDVVIRDDFDKVAVLMNPNPSVPRSESASDFQGAIRTTVINNSIVPIAIGLSENALNALCKVMLLVIHGSHNAYQRL
jgi:hypothetical protein